MFRGKRYRQSSTFVPPKPAGAAAPVKVTNVYEGEEGRATSLSSVLATWLENLGGGIGVGLAWWLGSMVLHGAAVGVAGLLRWLTYGAVSWDLPAWPDALRVGLASVIAGGLAFAILMILRSAIDEIVASGEWNELQALYDALEEEYNVVTGTWASDYSILQRRYNQLQAEYTMLLRKSGAVTPGPSAAVPANVPASYDDALLLLLRACNHESWSRETMAKRPYNWPRERWTEARRWLLDAGVLWYNADKPNVPQWVHADNMQAALLQLEERSAKQLEVRVM